MLPSSNNNIYTTPQLPSASSSTPNNGMIPSFQSNVDSHHHQQQQYTSHIQSTFSNHPPYHSIHSTASNGPGISHHHHHHHHHGHHTASLQPPIPIMNGNVNQKVPNANNNNNNNNRYVFPHPSMLMMNNSSQHSYMPPHAVIPSSSTSQPSQYSQENSRTIPPNVNNIPMNNNNTTVKYSNSTIMNNKYSTTIADNTTAPTTQESYLSTTVPSTAVPVWQNLVSEMVNPTSKKAKNELPLARIKKIMKSDEEVRTKTMISAEAPVLFAKACEMFIIELTLHAWVHTEESKRRTLQRNDIAAAIGKTDIFDFLIDIVPRENEKPTNNNNTSNNQSSHNHHQHASSSSHSKSVSATASYHHAPQQEQLIETHQEQDNIEEEIDDEDGFQIDDEDAPSDDEDFAQPQQDITPTKNEDVSKLLLPSLDPKSLNGENSIKFVPGVGVVAGSQKQANIERETSTILGDAPELTSEPNQFLDDSQTFLPQSSTTSFYSLSLITNVSTSFCIIIMVLYYYSLQCVKLRDEKMKECVLVQLRE